MDAPGDHLPPLPETPAPLPPKASDTLEPSDKLLVTPSGPSSCNPSTKSKAADSTVDAVTGTAPFTAVRSNRRVSWSTDDCLVGGEAGNYAVAQQLPSTRLEDMKQYFYQSDRGSQMSFARGVIERQKERVSQEYRMAFNTSGEIGPNGEPLSPPRTFEAVHRRLSSASGGGSGGSPQSSPRSSPRNSPRGSGAGSAAA
eukprot:UC4_evm1s870